MTVKELIAFLNDSDPNMPVYVSRDEEGNDFRHLYLVNEAKAIDGQYGSADIYDAEDDVKDAKKCVVLWPA
jgi:hypothetical protein